MAIQSHAPGKTAKTASSPYEDIMVLLRPGGMDIKLKELKATVSSAETMKRMGARMMTVDTALAPADRIISDIESLYVNRQPVPEFVLTEVRQQRERVKKLRSFD